MILGHIKILKYILVNAIPLSESNANVLISTITDQKQIRNVAMPIQMNCGSAYVENTCYLWLRLLPKFKYFNMIPTNLEMN